MKKFFVTSVIAFLFAVPVKIFANEIYVITVYHFTDPQQEVRLDTYLQTAYLPALHRQNINNIGVFKPIANDTSADKLIYVIVPYKTYSEIEILEGLLSKDPVYTLAGNDYINTSYQSPPYVRMEKIILTAFPLAPQMETPHLTSDKKDHIYELRSYESPTEKYHINKVKMFNEGGEINIFKRLNFNAVFYADVIAGSRMPNLMYLTSYENMEDREAHWKNFSDDADWKRISGMDEYKNNVSKADIILMHAATYSDY